jgi:hypothetical protein
VPADILSLASVFEGELIAVVAGEALSLLATTHLHRAVAAW